MNKKIFIYALTTLAFTACSSDDDGTTTPPVQERRLTVVVNETPFVSADGGEAKERMDTRGNVITTSSLSGFKMNYGDNKYSFTKNNNTWTSFSWPTGVENNVTINFYAYNAGTYVSNGNNNYLSFEADENASNNTDLLVAKHEKISFNDANGQVSLTFSHACAAIDFTVEISNTLHSKLNNDLTVNSIVLKNVVKQGDYFYNTESWTPSNTTTNYTLNNSEMTVTTDPQSLSCGTLFVIPQILGANAYFEISYNTGGANKTTSISLKDVKWEAGHHYQMNIRLGTDNIK